MHLPAYPVGILLYLGKSTLLFPYKWSDPRKGQGSRDANHSNCFYHVGNAFPPADRLFISSWAVGSFRAMLLFM
jgi:hypothetical protein